MKRIREKHVKQNLTCQLSVKVSGPALKVFLEQHCLKVVKFFHNVKNHGLNQKKRSQCENRLLNQRKKICASLPF